MLAIYERELKSYFSNLIAWITIAALLLFAGIFTMSYCLINGIPNFEYVVGDMAFIYIIAVPLLSMRVMAEERRQKTDQLLYALPLSMRQIVLGKYLAQLTIIAVPVAVLCFYPLILSLFGTVNLAAAYSSLLAYFLMGAAFLAVGFFISSLTENQAIAAGLCFLVILLNYFLSSLLSFVPSSSSASFLALSAAVLLFGLVLYLLTKNSIFSVSLVLLAEIVLFILQKVIPEQFEGMFSGFVEQLSIFEQFYTFMDGILDLTALVYFVAVAFLFLFLSVQSLEKRRWS